MSLDLDVKENQKIKLVPRAKALGGKECKRWKKENY
jgi:hypothetical protein